MCKSPIGINPIKPAHKEQHNRFEILYLSAAFHPVGVAANIITIPENPARPTENSIRMDIAAIGSVISITYGCSVLASGVLLRCWFESRL